jgi:hypothetical protein
MRNKQSITILSVSVLLAALGVAIFFQKQKPLQSVVSKEAAAKPTASISFKEEVKKFGPTLTEVEKKQFYTELNALFSKIAPATLDKDVLKQKLILLNQRGEAGVKAITETLSKTPTHDSEVEPRLALIDYLIYRGQFDETSKDQLEKLASEPVPNGIPLRYRATIIADKAEILGGLAALDWDRAAKIIASTEDKVLKPLMSDEAYHYLTSRGTNKTHATNLIKEVDPNFVPNG